MSMHFWLRNSAEMEFDDVMTSVKNDLLSKLEIEHQNFFLTMRKKILCVFFWLKLLEYVLIRPQRIGF